MRAQKMEFEDIYGIKKLAFNPGTITIISGANGAGKTSALNSIRLFFERGHNPGVIRKGAKRARGRMELDTGAVIDKVVTPTSTTLEIIDANGMVIPDEKEFIKTLGDSAAVDPAKLLAIDTTRAAGRRELIDELLKVMPVEFTGAEIEDCLKPCQMTPSFPVTNLQELGKLRKGLEETRRKIGVEVRDAEGTVKDLRKSLPPEEEQAEDWPAKVLELEAERSTLQRQELERIAGLEKDTAAERQGVNDDFATQERAIREKFQQDLAELEKAKQAKLSEIDALGRAAVQEVQRGALPDRERITEALATAREKAAQQERVKGAKATIDQMWEKASKKTLEYDRFSTTLQALDALKKAKLDALPITGLEFDGETVLVDGVEWCNVNTAKLTTIALQLCTMRAGDLPFLICDKVQDLDDDTWHAVEKACIDAGFQIVAARVVSGEPLKVEVVEP